MPNMVFGAHVAIPEKSAKIKTKASIMVKKKTKKELCITNGFFACTFCIYKDGCPSSSALFLTQLECIIIGEEVT